MGASRYSCVTFEADQVNEHGSNTYHAGSIDTPRLEAVRLAMEEAEKRGLTGIRNIEYLRPVEEVS